MRRDILREQHQLSEEIGAAITSVPLGEQPDEDELEQELEGLEQEAMDERMLNTGPVPVNSQLDRLPEAGKSERKSNPFADLDILRTVLTDLQWLERHPQSLWQRKTTRKPSWPSCAPKWPCSTHTLALLSSHMQLFFPRLAPCLA